MNNNLFFSFYRLVFVVVLFYQSSLIAGELVEISRIAVNGQALYLTLTPDGEKLYVGTRNPNKVVVIDTSSLQVIKTILINGLPNEIVAAPNGEYVYLAVSQGGGEQNKDGTTGHNRVEVIATADDTIVATIPINAIDAFGPTGVAITSNSSEVYVTVRGSNKADVIKDNVVTHSIPVGGQPVGVAITPNDDQVYVLGRTNSTVYRINVNNKNVSSIGSVDIGPNTITNDIVVTSDSRYAYVTYIDSAEMAIVDLTIPSTLNPLILTSGSKLAEIAIDDSQDRKMALVASYGSDEILVFDTNLMINDPTHSQIGVIKVDSGPRDVVFQNLPRAVAYVSNFKGKTVSVIGTESLKVELAFLRLRVSDESNDVYLAWKVDSEISNAGFRLRRAVKNQSGGYDSVILGKLNSKQVDFGFDESCLGEVQGQLKIVSSDQSNNIISAIGGLGESVCYSFTDNSILHDGTYYYVLEDFDKNGNSTFHCNKTKAVTIGQGPSVNLDAAMAFCEKHNKK